GRAEGFGTEVELDELGGEVHAALDGQRERAPDPPVDLHEDRARGPDPELHHGQARPAQLAQQPQGVVEQYRTAGPALAQRAGAARDRPLVQAAMLEDGERLPGVAQQFDAVALAGVVLL